MVALEVQLRALFAGRLGKLWHLEVGPDYKRPAVAPPEQFRCQIQASEATSLADLAWWEVFGDVHLQQLISEALARDQLLAVVDLYKALGGGWQLTDAQFSRVD